ncbi:MAG: ribonuclease III [Synergistaceae bacterium]|jgi:ribonuclease-3|nr:ribonuclease III [Synergistaceae bacterium]
MSAREDFERKLGYVFRNRALFEEALTHSSFANENSPARGNERLEFLGDAVLGLCVSMMFFSSCPELDEGGLSKARARAVMETTLAEWARTIGLPEMLKLGRGLETQGGRNNPSIVADAMEAILGAVFVDGGYEASYAAVTNLMGLYDGTRPQKSGDNKDSKSMLQEKLQACGDKPPIYHLTKRTGPPHASIFEVEASLADGTVLSAGKGNSIKNAEFAAAQAALEKLSRAGNPADISSERPNKN